MNVKPDTTRQSAPAPDAGLTLRQLAEAAFQANALRMPETLAEPSTTDTQRMLHELGVHQVELEMQNEELRRTQTELSTARARYFDLYHMAPVGYCTLDDHGHIRQANLAAASMLGLGVGTLRGRLLTSFIFSEDQDLYYLHRRQPGPAGASRSCELRMVKSNRALLWVQLATTLAEDGDGAPELRVVMNDVTQHKQVEADLRESVQQSRRLSRRVLEAQETERRRVAMELHDELGQALTAIKINLQVGERFRHQSPAELNTENIRIVDEALLQMRRLAYGLRPSMLDDLGLASALRWMAEQTAQRSGLVIRFEPDVREVRLAPEIEIAVFRIAQEALTNIVRHAHAQNVQMTLQYEGDVLVLDVQDDGCGFDLAAMRARAAAGGSMGVLGMEERATLIGAELLIESSAGLGSRLRLRCPLRARGEAQ
ncbi:MAG: histidine kinase [Hylemonella sp.]|nr:histidine kinase [Hylemonella sp.]